MHPDFVRLMSAGHEAVVDLSRFVDPYLEAGWKGKGWVAGNANLDKGFFLRAGLRWQIAR